MREWLSKVASWLGVAAQVGVIVGLCFLAYACDTFRWTI